MKYFDKTITVTDNTHAYNGSFLNGEVYSKDLINLVLAELEKINNPILLDIGACTGSFALLDIITSVKIHSFEPSRAYIELIENVKLNNSKTTCYNVAISDYIGKGNFNEVEANSCIALSMLGGIPASHKEVTTFDIEVNTIDNFCKSNKIIPSVIKIDTEGNELFVLKGAINTIKKHNPIIFAEYSQENANQYGYGIGEINELFKSLDYNCKVLDSGDIIGKPNK
jgi:FkbM family methyltransferase